MLVDGSLVSGAVWLSIRVCRYTVLYTEYLRLTRNKADPVDEHQRICLGAAIFVPDWGVVNVFSTHLSLSPKQHLQNVYEIYLWIQRMRPPSRLPWPLYVALPCTLCGTGSRPRSPIWGPRTNTGHGTCMQSVHRFRSRC